MAKGKPTVAQAQLQLQLYDLRREARIRQAREWYLQNFFPETMEDLQRLAPPGSQENVSMRRSPCTGVYLPLSLDQRPPETLLHADLERDDASAWWRFTRLQERVEEDFAARLPIVREAFDALQNRWLADADPAAGAEEATAHALETAAKLIARFERT